MCVTAAPAIVYQQRKGQSFRNILVCGHSAEVNAVSDIEVSVSMNQLKLIAAVSSEFLSVLEELTLSSTMAPKTKSTLDIKSLEVVPDSGVDCDMSSVSSPKEVKFQPKQIQVTHNVVPIEILVTGGKISFVLYDIAHRSGQSDSHSQRKIHSRRKQTEAAFRRNKRSGDDDSKREWREKLDQCETEEQESDAG